MENKGVKPEEILHIAKTGKWYHQNRELTKGEIDNLKSEATMIANTTLWKILISEAKYHAQKRAIIDVKDYEGLSKVQEFHKVIVLFEEFIKNIIRQNKL